MSNHPPENDPLGLFTDDQLEIAPEPLSPEHLALLEDLKAYDNPAAYSDTENPHLYKLRILSKAFEDLPVILKVELSGADFFAVLRECLFSMIRRDPNVEASMLADYQTEDWEEVREKVIIDPEYVIAEQECYWFFVRHLPTLMLSVYETFLNMTLMSVFKTSVFSATEKRELEPLIKKAIETGTKRLRDDMKKVVGTRSSGRPTRIETGPLPEIVQRVLDIAEAVMGDKRGKDAVPGLKGIANILDLSEDALGHQLRRAGFPWTMIRTHLESQT